MRPSSYDATNYLFSVTVGLTLLLSVFSCTFGQLYVLYGRVGFIFLAFELLFGISVLVFAEPLTKPLNASVIWNGVLLVTRFLFLSTRALVRSVQSFMLAGL